MFREFLKYFYLFCSIVLTVPFGCAQPALSWDEISTMSEAEFEDYLKSVPKLSPEEMEELTAGQSVEWYDIPGSDRVGFRIKVNGACKRPKACCKTLKK